MLRDDVCHEPWAILDGTIWRLWYNGRRVSLEQIDAVLHGAKDLGVEQHQ